MSVRSAQSITKVFTTRRFDTGAATDADSTPSGTLYVNGTADAASVTVTNITTGVYKAAVTLPTLAVGDVVDLRISATVNSVADNGIIWSDTKDIVIDAAGLADANAVKLGPSGSGTAQTARDIGASVLLSSGTGTGQLDFTSGVVKANATQFAGQTITCSGGVTIPAATLASTTNITAGTITTATNVTNGVTVTTNNDKTGYSLTATTGLGNQTANITGNLSGSVGSVTGNVGGNVVGSVGSLAAQAKADVNAEVDTALADVNLDHLLAVAIPAEFNTIVDPDSVVGYLAHNDAGTGTGTLEGGYNRTTDSLEAISLSVAGISAGSAPTAAQIADAIWDEAIADHVTAGSAGERVERLDIIASGGSGGLTNARAALLDNLDAAVSSRSTVTTAQVNAECDTALADVGLTTTVTGRIDVAVSTRLASASYTAPLDAAGTRSAIGLASANLDTQLTAIDDYLDSEVTAIKAKTDSLTFTVAGKIDANIIYVNSVQVDGTGVVGDEWGPV